MGKVVHEPLTFEEAVKIQRSLVPTRTIETQEARDRERAGWERYQRACAIVDQGAVAHRAAANYRRWEEENPYNERHSISLEAHQIARLLYTVRTKEFEKLLMMERGEEVQ